VSWSDYGNKKIRFFLKRGLHPDTAIEVHEAMRTVDENGVSGANIVMLWAANIELSDVVIVIGMTSILNHWQYDFPHFVRDTAFRKINVNAKTVKEANEQLFHYFKFPVEPYPPTLILEAPPMACNTCSLNLVGCCHNGDGRCNPQPRFWGSEPDQFLSVNAIKREWGSCSR